MPSSPDVNTESATHITSLHTYQEIFQQPLLWRTTVTRVRGAATQFSAAGLAGRVLFTGAGTSAYAAASIAAAWPHALAIPTTDLLVDPDRYLFDVSAVISLARSGNSPESAAVVERIRALRPNIKQFAITCNEDSALGRTGLDGQILLDPRTNDRSLVMTSSFSNLVLAGLGLASPDAVESAANNASRRAEALLPELNAQCREVASLVKERIVVLSSSPLLGWGHEAGLKTLEMTAGTFPVVAETYLGLRHGPMSFVRSDTLVLCLLSNDPYRVLYEIDLVRELRSKKLGHLVGIADPEKHTGLFDHVLPAIAPTERDELRTPFEILAPQLLGLHLSLRIGLSPDNPSPNGVINRVVQGVNIHPVPTAS